MQALTFARAITGRMQTYALILLLTLLPVPTHGEPILLADCEVAGIALNDNSTQVRQIVGAPIQTGPECKDCWDSVDTWFQYEGLRVRFVGDQVFEISVSNREYRLISGLGVGSTENEVTERYGEPQLFPGENQTLLVYPVALEGGRETLIKLVFTISDGAVTAFKVTVRDTY